MVIELTQVVIETKSRPPTRAGLTQIHGMYTSVNWSYYRSSRRPLDSVLRLPRFRVPRTIPVFSIIMSDL